MNIYPKNFEQKIDFNSIREYIIEKCLSPLGEEKVAEMQFSSEYETVNKWLEQTHEFLQIIQNKEDFPTDYFLDIRASLNQIDKDITVWFTETDIPLLANSMETIVHIVDFLNNSNKIEDRGPKYPELKKLADEIKVFPTIVEKANSILDKSGQIKDHASKLLATIRKNKIEAEKDITKAVYVAVRNAQAQGIIAKDVQGDMKGGHYVIPVTASNKRKIKGTVRDSSSSGKTFFIEPEAVVEASNRLRELESEERREIAHILTEFTNFVRGDISAILHSYEFMATIDFIRAKTLFAVRINGLKPILENKTNIEWNEAVHPLLDITLRREHKKVQPLDIHLTNTNRILLVSGVNAGGKSLCLKTLALLQYMLQCGLLIPVHKNSKAGIFERIFMDIGDGQSMENSLSTYTAHLTNMKFFVENNNDKTLLLIDEFGGGTEPQIGGAIAETLLDKFNRKASFGLITSHFQNLKHFAYNTKGVINGTMLYDTENNKPLYKLSIGNAGSSFAIEVARRIGLSENIISEASKKIGEDFINIDSFLQSIARDKLYWETKRKEIDSEIVKSEPTISEPINVSNTVIITNETKTMKIGDRIILKGQTAVGTILEIKGHEAIVAFGAIKSKVKLNRLIFETK
ncbi:DNA mismatch repair protein MutS [Flavobacterium sediminilitoris]|uniref:DNA mismatch repair protein MutS n=1 Tax=Flavobacterium sediminilitoris TaxID=2024526 RepID=A0ABY4HK53_9FLAO|nr:MULTISPECIES: MutS2/Smr-associated SH3 domain-containing protein [Flavobacterium]UOX33240.1 DNA mismatch repair protein MutS [Flavobacterium sediminilitoris]